MPIITSHVLFAETIGRYKVAQSREKLPSGDGAAVRAYMDDSDQITEIVISLCNRVLAAEPALVARLAAGEDRESELKNLVRRIIEERNIQFPCNTEELLNQVSAFLFGYGPLQPLIDDEDISDIDGTGATEFTVSRNGVRKAIALRFPNQRAYDTFCRLVIIRNGGVINENDSHCRVSDHVRRLRINVTVPPRSLNTPTISIRKHRKKSLSLDDLDRLHMLDSQLHSLLSHLACSNETILICGKGGSGKTTLLRALIEAMPILERVLIAESDSELYPEKPYCLLQKIKKVNEGGRPLSLRDLIADGLTMSLDSYCIGEIVGEEALEFLRAAYSGHRCLATIHADSAADAVERLLSLAQSKPNNENAALLRRMAGRSLDYVIYLHRFKVAEVIHVCDYIEERHEYEIETVWSAKEAAAADIAAGQSAVPLVPGP